MTQQLDQLEQKLNGLWFRRGCGGWGVMEIPMGRIQPTKLALSKGAEAVQPRFCRGRNLAVSVAKSWLDAQHIPTHSIIVGCCLLRLLLIIEMLATPLFNSRDPGTLPWWYHDEPVSTIATINQWQTTMTFAKS